MEGQMYILSISGVISLPLLPPGGAIKVLAIRFSRELTRNTYEDNM